MWVVVVYEPAVKGECLTLAEQTNQVFGPFGNDAEAEQWVLDHEEGWKGKEYLITPLVSPTILVTDRN